MDLLKADLKKSAFFNCFCCKGVLVEYNEHRLFSQKKGAAFNAESISGPDRKMGV
jgi:hypothetical protein